MGAAALYDVDEVARMLGRSPKSIYRLAAGGYIPHRRLGRSVVFPRAWLDRWLLGESAPGVRRLKRRAAAKRPAISGGATGFDVVAGVGER